MLPPLGVFSYDFFYLTKKVEGKKDANEKKKHSIVLKDEYHTIEEKYGFNLAFYGMV